MFVNLSPVNLILFGMSSLRDHAAANAKKRERPEEHSWGVSMAFVNCLQRTHPPAPPAPPLQPPPVPAPLGPWYKKNRNHVPMAAFSPSISAISYQQRDKPERKHKPKADDFFICDYLKKTNFNKEKFLLLVLRNI